MKHFRKFIFWLHLIAGLVGGIVIFIMSITGVLLAFEAQITKFAEREMRIVQPQETPRLGPQEIFTKVQIANPKLKPSGITMYSDKDLASTIALGREGILYVNPYTGDILGEGSKKTRAFFHITTDLHRWLAMHGQNRAIGQAVTGFCNAAFLFLAITGIYIWWPKQLTTQHLRPITTFRSNLKGRARDFNWHNVIGFWSLSILIIITATGMVFSYSWANNLIYTITGSEAPKRPSSPPNQAQAGQNRETKIEIPTNLNQLWAQAEKTAPTWKMISLRRPTSQNQPVSFFIDEGKSLNPFSRSQLTLNPTTAEVTKWEPYEQLNRGRQLRSWVRSLHTGEAAGLPGQIIAFIASLGACVLVYTGFALTWRRFSNWKATRNNKKSN